MRIVYSAGIWIEDARIKDGRVDTLSQAQAQSFQNVARASLDTIYRGKILAEAVDAGESLPSPVKKP